MKSKQKVNKIDDSSKKIKKPIGNKFSALVQDKVSKKARVLDDRKTLIQEYRQTKNKNEVQDKRFLKKRAPDSKLIQTLERKRNKKSIFNLDSDNEENDGEIKMTHKGVDLDQLNDYKEDEFDREGSDDENINARLVNDFHFEGFDDEGEKNAQNFNERKKTKQEIYKELIHKSKKEKFQRQQAALEMQEKVQELDDNFEDILGMLIKNPNQYKESKSVMAKKDSYLKLTTELQSDRRIKPEADNTVDPNREGKKKKKRNGQVEEENEDESDIGDDNEVLGKKKINRKMRDAIKKQEKTNKLMGFLDDIKAAKKEDSDEDEDLEDVDLSEDEDEDGEGEGDEDMDDEEGDDDGLGDDDDDDLDGLDDDY